MAKQLKLALAEAHGLKATWFVSHIGDYKLDRKAPILKGRSNRGGVYVPKELKNPSRLDWP
jgi:hypothetical protein